MSKDTDINTKVEFYSKLEAHFPKSATYENIKQEDCVQILQEILKYIVEKSLEAKERLKFSHKYHYAENIEIFLSNTKTKKSWTLE